ncbi:unnamed protein product [Dracunculus medinensis]|uniref:ShKT domain-containing protein n=1 Tax=Dracunculus medinensis TaxID=318479 RepID=A0A0N4URH5_DRAME|nr:unnamed protein product [Dracunculus medinensis]
MKILTLKNLRSSQEFDDYKVSENCKKYPKLAEELCPHSCALCCKTKEYRCNNTTTPIALASAVTCRDERVNCGSRPDLCVGPYAAVYANQCKSTCGLCNRG